MQFWNQGHLIQKTTDAEATETENTWTEKSNLLPNGGKLSDVHLQICFNLLGEKRITHSQAAHTLFLEYRRAHAATVGVILLLARVLRDFPRAWVSHLVHCGLFFLKKSPDSLEQTYPLVTLQGSECSDQHIHLRNVLPLHLLMTYIFVILIGAERVSWSFYLKQVLI